MRIRRFAALGLVAIVTATACGRSSADARRTVPDDTRRAAPEDGRSAVPDAAHAAVPDDVRATATEVVDALATHDMARVASVVHPTRGLRFSPYPYVDTTADHVVAAPDVATLWQSSDSLRWGSYDGTGDPILLPYASYHAKFVYDADFRTAPQVAVDSEPIGTGNATNNIAKVYPGASVVEYHWPGRDPSLSGMDWRSLWLVFEREQSRWYLVAIVHGAWTI